jgi:hypothetical protein
MNDKVIIFIAVLIIGALLLLDLNTLIAAWLIIIAMFLMIIEAIRFDRRANKK